VISTRESPDKIIPPIKLDEFSSANKISGLGN
jgi:hypothetical protein